MAQFRSVAGFERAMTAESEHRFAAYGEALSAALGHADRRGPFKDRRLGLLTPVERKSVEPLAAKASAYSAMAELDRRSRT